MISGSVYGVVLNDREEILMLGGALSAPPYGAPPQAPVIYIKPRTCLRIGGAAVPLPAEIDAVVIAATILVVFGADTAAPVAAALALDVSEPHDNYYRPAIRQRCRDGFLPIGPFAAFEDDAMAATDIVTTIDGVEAHRWSLDRLVRDIPTLIADLGSFMTLADGDALLIGVPGDAPRAKAGQTVRVEGGGLPSLSTRIEPETTA